MEFSVYSISAKSTSDQFLASTLQLVEHSREGRLGKRSVLFIFSSSHTTNDRWKRIQTFMSMEGKEVSEHYVWGSEGSFKPFILKPSSKSAALINKIRGALFRTLHTIVFANSGFSEKALKSPLEDFLEVVPFIAFPSFKIQGDGWGCFSPPQTSGLTKGHFGVTPNRIPYLVIAQGQNEIMGLQERVNEALEKYMEDSQALKGVLGKIGNNLLLMAQRGSKVILVKVGAGRFTWLEPTKNPRELEVEGMKTFELPLKGWVVMEVAPKEMGISQPPKLWRNDLLAHVSTGAESIVGVMQVYPSLRPV